MPETRLSSDQTAAKRLEQLRKQVYGNTSSAISYQLSDKTKKSDDEYRPQAGRLTTDNSDITYLRQDLTKIAILSTLVLGIQLFLYYAVSHNLIRLTI